MKFARVALMFLLAALPAQNWLTGTIDKAFAAAKDSKAGLVLLYCWRNDHPNCKAMFADTMEDKAVVAALADFTLQSCKRDEPDALAVQEKYGVLNLPTILFLTPDGTVVDVVPGYVEPKKFLAELARIRAGKETIAALKEAVAAKPGELALQLTLAKKLAACGDPAGADKALDAIVAKDPKGSTEVSAEAQFLKIRAATFKPEIAPKDIDLKPLKDFLIKQKNKRILFLGYERMAAAEYARDNLKAACEAAERAWKNVPPDQLLDYGQQLQSNAYARHKDLDKGQLKQVLDISEKTLKAAEAVAKERGDAFLANALHLHATIQIVNNLRKEAFAGMERAMQLNPKDENLKKALDNWKSGAK